jgi:hypothetical protein
MQLPRGQLRQKINGERTMQVESYQTIISQSSCLLMSAWLLPGATESIDSIGPQWSPRHEPVGILESECHMRYSSGSAE